MKKIALLVLSLLVPSICGAQLIQSGTATASGTLTITVSNGSAGSCSTSGLLITSASPLPNATQNVAYSTNITASGGTAPYSFSVSQGSLPASLILASGGTLSGTTSALPGLFNFTLQVTDSTSAGNGGPCTATQANSITVVAPTTLQIQPASLPDAIQNQAYSYALIVTGGTGPYTCAYTNATRPPGTITWASGNQCTLQGNAGASTGTFNFDVTATDSLSNTGHATLTINVVSAAACGPSVYYPCSRRDYQVAPAANSPVNNTSTPGVITNPPQGFGPNTCVPGSLTSCNNQTGANNTVNDPDFSTPIIRCTDANTAGGASLMTSDSAGDRIWSALHSKLMLKSTGGARYIMAFNTSTNQCTGLISIGGQTAIGPIIAAANGGVNPAFVRPTFSTSDDTKLWVFADTKLWLISCTGTMNQTCGAPTLQFDFSQPNCLAMPWIQGSYPQYFQIQPTNNNAGNFVYYISSAGAAQATGVSEPVSWCQTSSCTVSDGAVTWTNTNRTSVKISGASEFRASNDDVIHGGAVASISGGQDSTNAIYHVAWKTTYGANGGCDLVVEPTAQVFHQGTNLGTMTITSPVGTVVPKGYWHAGTATSSGSVDQLDGYNLCISPTGGCNRRYWTVGTANATECTDTNSCPGHTQQGQTGELNGNGSGNYYWHPYTAPVPASGSYCNGTICGFLLNPTTALTYSQVISGHYCQGGTAGCSIDSHPSWIDNAVYGVADAGWIFNSTAYKPTQWFFAAPAFPLVAPIGEIWGCGPNSTYDVVGANNGRCIRVAHTFSSSLDYVSAANFDNNDQLVQISPDGAAVAFNSDMLGTLGPIGAVGTGKTCQITTNNSTLCRADVFVALPQ